MVFLGLCFGIAGALILATLFVYVSWNGLVIHFLAWPSIGIGQAVLITMWLVVFAVCMKAMRKR